MISFLMGELADIGVDTVVVCCAGVGYEVNVPQSVFGQLPPVNSQIRLYTYLQVREDAVALYGFLNKNDLQFFKLLIGVNGIGPKGALGILSAMTPDALRMAIIANDAKAIAKAPGIGIKTAQKMILELADKIAIEDVLKPSTGVANPANSSAGLSAMQSDALLALTALGYSEAEALRAIRSVSSQEASDESTLIKAALRQMV